MMRHVMEISFHLKDKTGQDEADIPFYLLIMMTEI